jgi:hypothetical protein
MNALRLRISVGRASFDERILRCEGGRFARVFLRFLRSRHHNHSKDESGGREAPHPTQAPIAHRSDAFTTMARMMRSSILQHGKRLKLLTKKARQRANLKPTTNLRKKRKLRTKTLQEVNRKSVPFVLKLTPARRGHGCTVYTLIETPLLTAPLRLHSLREGIGRVSR